MVNRIGPTGVVGVKEQHECLCSNKKVFLEWWSVRLRPNNTGRLRPVLKRKFNDGRVKGFYKFILFSTVSNTC